MLSNDWDQHLKFLTKTNPQAFVSFLLEGATFLGKCDKELQARTMYADLVYEVQWQGEKIILHAEFQSSRDKEMARRVWEYNVSLECATQLPVYSVVLYLVKDGNAVEPFYERRLCTGELIHQFHFRNLKLWEVNASELRRPGMEGILPLLPLTRDGARREVIEEVIVDLARAKRQDLLPIAYCIAALVFPANSENREWLKERFRPLLHLFQNSWAYQDLVADSLKKGLQEGEQKGEKKSLQETCIRYVQKRFPSLVEDAKVRLRSVGDIKRLQMAFDAMVDATTTTEVEEILRRLSDEPQSSR